MDNTDFIREDGELKENDWFCSKFRVENKFFYFVQVDKIMNNGFLCKDTGVTYPKTDVLYRAVLKKPAKPLP